MDLDLVVKFNLRLSRPTSELAKKERLLTERFGLELVEELGESGSDFLLFSLER